MGLAPSNYSVRATLAGFCPAAPYDLVLATGQSIDANFTLLVAAPSGPLWVEMDPPYYWHVQRRQARLHPQSLLLAPGVTAPETALRAHSGYWAPKSKRPAVERASSSPAIPAGGPVDNLLSAKQ